MRISDIYSTDGILKETGRRIKQARISADMTQKHLSEACGVSLRCVARLEAGEDVQFSNLIRVITALGLKDNLETLIPDQTLRPSYFVKEEKTRYRVRHKAGSDGESDSLKAWKWGDES